MGENSSVHFYGAVILSADRASSAEPSLGEAMRGSSRRTLCFLALALLLTLPALAQSTGKTVRKQRVAEDSAITRAEAAIDKKDYAAAEQALNQALKSAPNDYQALYDLGFVYNATGRKTEAIDAYRRSVAANAKIFESNLNLGLLLARAGNAEAEKYLRAATQLKPTAQPEEGLARAWLSLGHVLASRDPKSAVQAFAEAARLRPADPEPHLAAGGVLERQKDAAAAEREYQEALRLDPKSGEALTAQANLYMTAKRLPEAEEALRKLLALQPQNGGAHVQLGRVLAAQDKPDQAVAELEAGFSLVPNDPAAQRDAADIYAAAKKYDRAEALYRALLQKTPNDAAVRHLLGLTLLKQRKFPEAQSELLAALKLKPDLGPAYGDLAVAASENANYPLAIKALDARARLLPEIPATYFLRATAYDHLRDYKQAADNYRQFLAVAKGKFPDQEWQARHRLIAIDPNKKK